MNNFSVTRKQGFFSINIFKGIFPHNFFPILQPSSSSSWCFLWCPVDLDCFGLFSGPWMRVQSSDSVVYAVINRGSYLSATGCVCLCVACPRLAALWGINEPECARASPHALSPHCPACSFLHVEKQVYVETSTWDSFPQFVVFLFIISWYFCPLTVFHQCFNGLYAAWRKSSPIERGHQDQVVRHWRHLTLWCVSLIPVTFNSNPPSWLCRFALVSSVTASCPWFLLIRWWGGS